GGQQDYLIIKLIGITITAVLQAEANNQAGTETVSLTFQKVDFEYRPPSPARAPGVHFKWDVPAHGPSERALWPASSRPPHASLLVRRRGRRRRRGKTGTATGPPLRR